MLYNKSNKRPVGWCLIPPEVMARNDLSNSEKLLLGRINGLRNEKGYCYATNRWLGEQIGLQEGTISNIISSLVRKGLIDRKIIRDENKEVIERQLYPIEITQWISAKTKLTQSSHEIIDTPVHENVEGSIRDFSNRYNNNGKAKPYTKSVFEHIEENPSIYEEVNTAIDYYINNYQCLIRKMHPRITLDQWSSVKYGFELIAGEYTPSIEEWEKMINKWFDMNIRTDYNIIHFSTGDFIKNRYFEECY
ncbi:MAG: helix-turn-helix domain-containing protein [Candidatus Woesebacteria bacterium]|jgi:DNA-binding MarR family transcriptional regulator